MRTQVFHKKSLPILLFLLIFSSWHTTYSQEIARESNRFFERVRFGGSLGLSFSNGFTNAHLAPKAIYDFNPYTSAGVGLSGSYTDARNYNAYTFGGSILGLFRPIQALQISAEFEELNVTRNVHLEGLDRKESYWYPALFIGAGYTTGRVTAGFRYDVLYDPNRSIYGEALMPFVSIYF